MTASRRVAVIVGTTVVLVFALGFTLPRGGGSTGIEYLVPLVVIFGGALYLLRNRPVVSLVLVLFLVALVTPLNYLEVTGSVSLLAIGIPVGRLAALRRWPVSVAGAVGAFLVQDLLGVAFFAREYGDAISVSTVLALVTTCAWTIGNTVGQRRENAELRRAEETERAVTEERLRIAREMHDLIAHSLGAIAIQAGVGRRVIDNQPAEARNALDAIESTSRQALAELRRTLTALRRSDPEGVPAAPAPGLADLEGVLAVARDSGVQVDVSRAGDVRPLPADLDLAAFRIVQEAVTNVVRHAGTDRASVRLEYRADALAISVVDDGVGSGDAPGTGYGLVGMRERVTLLDGEFEAGPRPEGGFRVSALVPLP
ncbi:sensor histidine kinase [Cryptosporangium phraense]|uniref:histidine kinase n=1 Tax=Cryptosporangium phraense TaxID=2593070 RepID=A0A545AT33_9ACTN|nr:sensor histidine kinase [Cryptosporangium phraense]TQS44500.1 sensor histidine kinase [Cryptosporangium phraense]